MRLKALTLGYVLNTHIMGFECLENFLQALKGRGDTFFSTQSSQPIKIQKFLGMKKLNFGGQNDSKKFFFLNVSKVFGT